MCIRDSSWCSYTSRNQRARNTIFPFDQRKGFIELERRRTLHHSRRCHGRTYQWASILSANFISCGIVQASRRNIGHKYRPNYDHGLYCPNGVWFDSSQTGHCWEHIRALGILSPFSSALSVPWNDDLGCHEMLCIFEWCSPPNDCSDIKNLQYYAIQIWVLHNHSR